MNSIDQPNAPRLLSLVTHLREELLEEGLISEEEYRGLLSSGNNTESFSDPSNFGTIEEELEAYKSAFAIAVSAAECALSIFQRDGKFAELQDLDELQKVLVLKKVFQPGDPSEGWIALSSGQMPVNYQECWIVRNGQLYGATFCDSETIAPHFNSSGNRYWLGASGVTHWKPNILPVIPDSVAVDSLVECEKTRLEPLWETPFHDIKMTDLPVPTRVTLARLMNASPSSKTPAEAARVYYENLKKSPAI